MDQTNSAEMGTPANRGEDDPNSTTKTREQKRQRDYYVKTKSKRRREESDDESNEPNVQSDANLFTAAQTEAIRDIVFDYMCTDFQKDKPTSNLVSGLTSGLLCGIGAMGIGSKILQNKEVIGTLVSDFLKHLGQSAPQLPIKSTDGEGMQCASGLALPQLTQPPPSQSSDSVDVEKLTLVRNC